MSRVYKLRGDEYLRWLPKHSSKAYDILVKLSLGYTQEEIAHMGLTTKNSIGSQVNRMRKLSRARNTVHLIQLAHEAGIL